MYEAETPTPSDESINRGLVCVARIPSYTDFKDPDALSKKEECRLQKYKKVQRMHSLMGSNNLQNDEVGTLPKKDRRSPNQPLITGTDAN